MESRGKVCVAHLQGRAWLRPVCPSVALAYPSSGGRSDEVLGGGAVVGCLPFRWGWSSQFLGRPLWGAKISGHRMKYSIGLLGIQIKRGVSNGFD